MAICRVLEVLYSTKHLRLVAAAELEVGCQKTYVVLLVGSQKSYIVLSTCGVALEVGCQKSCIQETT